MEHEPAASYKLEFCNVQRDNERVKELELHLFCILH